MKSIGLKINDPESLLLFRDIAEQETGIKAFKKNDEYKDYVYLIFNYNNGIDFSRGSYNCKFDIVVNSFPEFLEKIKQELNENKSSM